MTACCPQNCVVALAWTERSLSLALFKASFASGAYGKFYEGREINGARKPSDLRWLALMNRVGLRSSDRTQVREASGLGLLLLCLRAGSGWCPASLLVLRSGRFHGLQEAGVTVRGRSTEMDVADGPAALAPFRQMQVEAWRQKDPRCPTFAGEPGLALAAPPGTCCAV